jgi:small subunit ribosomal protein S20
MANRKAQIKTIEVNAIRCQRNKSNRTALHTQLRKLDDAMKTGDKDGIQKELKNSLIRLDKSASKGIVHKKKASRKKARLCAQVAALA